MNKEKFINNKKLQNIKNNYDIYILIFIIFVYTIISFINLGIFKEPQTIWKANVDNISIVKFKNIESIKKIQYYIGPSHEQEFEVYYSLDENNWHFITDVKIDHSQVFTWNEINTDIEAKYIIIAPKSDNLMLMECAFKNSENKIIPIYKTNSKNLFDEQDLIPNKPSYKNGMYFDEIYHARTAYEIVNHLNIYENTHPPLGKFIISLGIKFLGMAPFSWRIMGNLFGILMIPIIYIFSKKIFIDKYWTIFSTIIFTFDFMHFTQTRIATIDTYITFFIMLMYYFMYKYYCLSLENIKISKTFIPLGLSGIFMGLAIATKWQGIYASIGLAIIFICSIIIKHKEYNNSSSINKNLNFKVFILKTFSVCIVFFIIIPISIYFLSYMSYIGSPNFNNIKDILNNQISMFDYHSKLVATHPYSSRWWEWPIIKRPVFYYCEILDNNKKIGISTFGNPAIWWIGIIAFCYTIYDLIKNNSKISLFLIISYLSQIVPWMFISRITYIYHYFPATPFLVLMITLFFKNYINKKFPKIKKIYILSVILLFIMFYPVISGYPVYETYVNNFLKWFSDWQLIA